MKHEGFGSAMPTRGPNNMTIRIAEAQLRTDDLIRRAITKPLLEAEHVAEPGDRRVKIRVTEVDAPTSVGAGAWG